MSQITLDNFWRLRCLTTPTKLLIKRRDDEDDDDDFNNGYDEHNNETNDGKKEQNSHINELLLKFRCIGCNFIC